MPTEPCITYIPRIVSVHPYQVGDCDRTFDASLRNNLYQFFIHRTSLSDRFKCLYYLKLKLMCDGEQLQ